MSSILIIGESGSGKSTSLRNINGSETILINALNKPLPFKGGKKKFGDNIVFTDNSRAIVSKIHEADKNSSIKIVVIDDFQACMTNAYMSTIEVKGYEKFTKIGRSIWDIVNAANSCRGDLKVVLLAHSETDTNGKIKCKTIGKLVDEKISLEGMCTIVLHSKASNGKYTFLTQNDGTSIAKSPMGMFPTIEIDNDLSLVIKTIDSYYDEGDLPESPKGDDVFDITHKIYSCDNVKELEQIYRDSLDLRLSDEDRERVVKSCADRKKAILGATHLILNGTAIYDKPYNDNVKSAIKTNERDVFMDHLIS